MSLKEHWSDPFDADETVESLEAERDARIPTVPGALSVMLRAYYENRIRLAREQDRRELRMTEPEITTPPIFPAPGPWPFDDEEAEDFEGSDPDADA